jgi:hypothetical protein
MHEKLLDLCAGNEPAVSFIESFWGLCEVWDDLVDRDKAVPPDTVSSALMWALFGLPGNPFYRTFSNALGPAMAQAIASWQTANQFERSGDRARVEQAYFMRCAPYDLFATVALLAGGHAKHMEAVAYFRSLAPGDTLESYMQEHLGD